MRNKFIYFFILITFALITKIFAQPFIVIEKHNMPIKISNNAVTHAVVSGIPHVYSFGGIDSTKLYSGINKKCFRYNTLTDFWDTIATLPDTLGKIAGSASTVKNKIYIIGGYHVLANTTEISSNKVHVYDPQLNIFLPDASNVPLAIDDQVQVVWRDSLIYVITGWSNTGNVALVQIFNPVLNTWTAGTNVPNNNNFKAFGANGTIIGDTIYYYGGASIGSNFPAQNKVRKGIINPSNPSQITWSNPVNILGINGYRPCVTSDSLGNIFFIGGSSISYNYNAIAYNGSGGVNTNNNCIVLNTKNNTFINNININYPMDLRGIANVSNNKKYIVGGMYGLQKVSNKTLELTYNTSFFNTVNEKKQIIDLYTWQDDAYLFIKYNAYENTSIEIINILGNKIYEGDLVAHTTKINKANISNGFYTLIINKNEGFKHIVIE